MASQISEHEMDHQSTTEIGDRFMQGYQLSPNEAYYDDETEEQHVLSEDATALKTETISSETNSTSWQVRFLIREAERGSIYDAKKLKSISSKRIKQYLKQYCYFDQVSGLSFFSLGWRNELGIGVGKVPNKNWAANYYRWSASNNHHLGEYGLGRLYYNDGYFDYAETMFRLSADSGNSYGQLGMATCYYHGRGVRCNIDKAREYYILSAENGNKVAQYWIYLVHDKLGLGIQKAEYYLRLSAMAIYGPAIDLMKGCPLPLIIFPTPD